MNKIIRDKKTGRVALFDSRGRISEYYDEITSIDNKHFWVEIGDWWGIIDKYGNFVIDMHKLVCKGRISDLWK